MANEDIMNDNDNIDEKFFYTEDSSELDLEEIHIAHQKAEHSFDIETEEEELLQNEAQIEAYVKSEQYHSGVDDLFDNEEYVSSFQQDSADTPLNLVLDLNIIDGTDVSEEIKLDVTEDEVIEEALMLEDFDVSLSDEDVQPEEPEKEPFIFHDEVDNTVNQEQVIDNQTLDFEEIKVGDLEENTTELLAGDAITIDVENGYDSSSILDLEDNMSTYVQTFEAEPDSRDDLTLDFDETETQTSETEIIMSDDTNLSEAIKDHTSSGILDLEDLDFEEVDNCEKTDFEEFSSLHRENVGNCAEQEKIVEEKKSNNSLSQVSPENSVTEKIIVDALNSFEEKIVELTVNSNTAVSQEFINLTKQFEAINGLIHSLPKEIQAEQIVGIQKELQDVKEQLTLQLVQLFEGISFNEEVNELKNYIEDRLSDKINPIKKLVDDLSSLQEQNKYESDYKQLLQDVETKILEKLDYLEEQEIFGGKTDLVKRFEQKITDTINNSVGMLSENINKKDEDGEYSYSLVDVESDLTKMRVVVNEIATSVKDINCHFLETAEGNPQFETLSDDISSISKRTNKLILTSEDANKTLKHYLEDFEQTVQKMQEGLSNLNSYPQQVSVLNGKIDNITKLVHSMTSSDKAINDALLYLAQWIDGASESFEKIKKELNTIKTDSFSVQTEKIKTLEYKIEALETKMEEQAKSDRELKSMLEMVVEQLSVANNSLKRSLAIDDKLDMLEHKMSKFEKNINKIASYIEE